MGVLIKIITSLKFLWDEIRCLSSAEQSLWHIVTAQLMPTATIYDFSFPLTGHSSILHLRHFNDSTLAPEAFISRNCIILHLQAFIKFSRCLLVVYFIYNCQTISLKSASFSNSGIYPLLPESIIHQISTQFLQNSTKYTHSTII